MASFIASERVLVDMKSNLDATFLLTLVATGTHHVRFA
jgi:hypothetical protein